jgi:Cdc6-like AAA superfamily ATPase
MNLFTADTNSVLKEPKWLQPLSDPPGGMPLCRNADLKLMARYLTDVFKSGQARNLFIWGPPGTGKTVCARYLLQQIRTHAEETNAPIAVACVNAGKTRNPYYTLLEIVKQLGVTAPDAGWQMNRLKAAFEGVLRDKSVVIMIDEVEAVIFKEREPLVYYLSRQPKTTLILISNDMDDMVKLPERTLSTLQPVIMRMEPYTNEEIKQILKQRIQHACKPNAIPEKLLTMIAKTASEGGDIRFGFHVLLTAALLTERAQRQTIIAADVASAVEKENRIRKLKKIEALRDKLRKQLKQYERD